MQIVMNSFWNYCKVAFVVTMILRPLGNGVVLYTIFCRKQNGRHVAVDILNSKLEAILFRPQYA